MGHGEAKARTKPGAREQRADFRLVKARATRTRAAFSCRGDIGLREGLRRVRRCAVGEDRIFEVVVMNNNNKFDIASY